MHFAYSETFVRATSVKITKSTRQCSNIILVTETYVYPSALPESSNRRAISVNPNKHSVPSAFLDAHIKQKRLSSQLSVSNIHTQTPQLVQKKKKGGEREDHETTARNR